MKEQIEIPLPNPADWTDTEGAAAMLGRNRATVYDLVNRGVLTRYRAGTTSIYWVREVREIVAARRRLEGKK